MPHKNTSTGHFMVCIRFWIWALDFDAHIRTHQLDTLWFAFDFGFGLWILMPHKNTINWTLYGLHSILDLGFGF